MLRRNHCVTPRGMSVSFCLGLWSLEIYIGKLLEFSDTHLKFDGHFRIPEKFLPVRHILEIGDRNLLVRITKKEELQNTSVPFYDEGEQGMICLSPSAIIRLEYEVIRRLKTEEEYWVAVEEIAKEMLEIDKFIPASFSI